MIIIVNTYPQNLNDPNNDPDDAIIIIVNPDDPDDDPYDAILTNSYNNMAFIPTHATHDVLHNNTC